MSGIQQPVTTLQGGFEGSGFAFRVSGGGWWVSGFEFHVSGFGCRVDAPRVAHTVGERVRVRGRVGVGRAGGVAGPARAVLSRAARSTGPRVRAVCGWPAQGSYLIHRLLYHSTLGSRVIMKKKRYPAPPPLAAAASSRRSNSTTAASSRSEL